MTQTADSTATNTARQPDVTLDYARGGGSPLFPTFRHWWLRSRAAVQERIDGFYEFLGPILYVLGGLRQLLLATALCMLLVGLGLCVEREPFTGGPRWMGIGGFLLGLVIPLKRSTK